MDTIDTINTIACSSFNWPTDKRWKTFFKTVMGEYGRSDFVLRTYCFTLSFFLISHLSFGPMNWMNEYWNFSCLFVKLYLGLLFFEFSFLFLFVTEKDEKTCFNVEKMISTSKRYFPGQNTQHKNIEKAFGVPSTQTMVKIHNKWAVLRPTKPPMK